MRAEWRRHQTSATHGQLRKPGRISIKVLPFGFGTAVGHHLSRHSARMEGDRETRYKTEHQATHSKYGEPIPPGAAVGPEERCCTLNQLIPHTQTISRGGDIDA